MENRENQPVVFKEAQGRSPYVTKAAYLWGNFRRLYFLLHLTMSMDYFKIKKIKEKQSL